MEVWKNEKKRKGCDNNPKPDWLSYSIFKILN